MNSERSTITNCHKVLVQKHKHSSGSGFMRILSVGFGPTAKRMPASFSIRGWTIHRSLRPGLFLGLFSWARCLDRKIVVACDFKTSKNEVSCKRFTGQIHLGVGQPFVPRACGRLLASFRVKLGTWNVERAAVRKAVKQIIDTDSVMPVI